MEWRILVLRHFLNLSIKLRCTCLIDAACVCQTAKTNCLKDAKHTCRIHVSCEFRGVETYLHVALCSKIIDFSWTYLTNNLKNRHGVAHITIMQVEMRLTFEVSDALTIID